MFQKFEILFFGRFNIFSFNISIILFIEIIEQNNFIIIMDKIKKRVITYSSILIPLRNNSFSFDCRLTNFTTGGLSSSVDLWLKPSGYGSVSKRRFWMTYISANCVHSFPFPILYSCSAF